MICKRSETIRDICTRDALNLDKRRSFRHWFSRAQNDRAVAKRACRAVSPLIAVKNAGETDKRLHARARACRLIVNKFAGRARKTLGDLYLSLAFNRRAVHCKERAKSVAARVRRVSRFPIAATRYVDPTCSVSIIKSLRHAAGRYRYTQTQCCSVRAERYRSAVRVVHGAIYRGERLWLESCNRDSDCAAERCKLIVSLLSRLMGSILPGPLIASASKTIVRRAEHTGKSSLLLSSSARLH